MLTVDTITPMNSEREPMALTAVRNGVSVLARVGKLILYAEPSGMGAELTLTAAILGLYFWMQLRRCSAEAVVRLGQHRPGWYGISARPQAGGGRPS